MFGFHAFNSNGTEPESEYQFLEVPPSLKSVQSIHGSTTLPTMVIFFLTEAWSVSEKSCPISNMGVDHRFGHLWG